MRDYFNKLRKLRLKNKKLKLENLRLKRIIASNLYKNSILEEQANEYKRLAYTDSLTSLNNRRSLDNASNYGSVIIGDIDHFKNINDEYGHIMGDNILIEISMLLKKYIRDSDLVCRWGGEEFLILLKTCDTKSAFSKAIDLKERVMELSDKYGFAITMSFGVSSLDQKTLEVAINEADLAMYDSKKRGRNRVSIYKINK